MKRGHTPHIRVPPSADAAPDRTVRIDAGGARSTPEAEGIGSRGGNDDIFSQYAILGKIGDGGMGVVYLARDRKLGRVVAIKRLSAQAQGSVTLRHRFLHEARAVAALNHIHIVHIYALGEDAEGPYLVMEYVPGPDDASGGALRDGNHPSPPVTLDTHIVRNGQLTVNEAIALLVKISRAVAYAHANGVIHRDLKPTNILLDATGEPKIVDFGLARLVRAEEESKLTVPGEKLLSLGYGAPEQERDASGSDERADVYGLGALLYFAITAQNPRYFREQDIPVPLRDVLVKALATDREQRWPSAAAFSEALRAVQSRTRVETPPAKTTWRCKWCDTVNPLSIRFCSECGWDGGENCPECGAESFFGVQYCGTCGADARTYESMAALLRRMHACLDAHDFERTVSFAGRTQGFEPAGPSGRRLLKDIQDLRDQALRQVARRNQLRELVPVEIRAENFERARDFIQESRALSGNAQLFVEEERQLPELRLRRDLRRIRLDLHEHRWAAAGALCESLLRDAGRDHPECLALRRTIIIRRRLRRALRIGLAGAALLLLYLSALPAGSRLAPSPLPATLRQFGRPGLRLYRQGALARPLNAYARLWGETNLLARFAAPATVVTPAPTPLPADPAELRQLREAYTRQIDELSVEQRRYASTWPADYLRELDSLMERQRSLGDYEAWIALQNERQQFEISGQISPEQRDEAGDLPALKQKYRRLLAASRLEGARRVVAAGKKYVNDLTDLQRTYTRDGRMETAAGVNNEIRRVRAAPEIVEAEALLAASGSHGESSIAAELPLPADPAQGLAELTPLRERYQKSLAEIEAAYTRNSERWPGLYLTALRQLMEVCRGAGDYAGWEAAKTEMERFEIDRVIQPGDAVLDPPQLGALQQTHLDLLTGYRTTRARDLVAQAEKQLATLSAMQKQCTMAGDMEAAGQVNAEIRRIRTSADILAAQAELAPPPPPAATTNSVPAAAADAPPP